MNDEKDKKISELEERIKKLEAELLNKVLEKDQTTNVQKQDLQNVSNICQPSGKPSVSSGLNTVQVPVPTTSNSDSTQTIQGLTKPDFNVYAKRKGTVDLGREYEFLMCAYYALKLCFDENVIDFKMTTNNKIYGDFDDVALSVTFTNNLKHHFLIQLKHKENESKSIDDKMLSAENNDFSLSKYFVSFQNLQNRDNVSCILFTNKICHLKDKSKFQLKNENVIVNHPTHDVEHWLIDTVCDDQTAHIFNFEQDGQNSQNFTDFFKCFYLFTSQKNCHKIQVHIDELLVKQFGCKVDFINFMREWWKGRFEFTKHDVIVKLAESALSPFVQKIPQNSNEPLSEKSTLLKSAIMQFEMTLIRDYDENIANSLVKMWTGESADLDIMNKASIKYGLTSTGVKDKNDFSSEETTKVLWYLNIIPLIIKYDDKEEIRIKCAIELLAMETNRKKLILVGKEFEETFSKWKVFKNLYDLRNETFFSKITESFKVSLQNRPSISLEKLIRLDVNLAKEAETETQNSPSTSREKLNNFDEDLSKEVETRTFFLMLENDFCVGTQMARLPVAYIPRNLTRDGTSICEEKAFSTFDKPVNIVKGQPGIGKTTLMTYLSHLCPPDFWCVRVNLIKYSSLFSQGESKEQILNEFLKDEDSFLVKVKALFYRNKKIYFLLDGLDEIDDECVDNVLNFIKYVSEEGIRVWISSREYLEQKLANYFKLSCITITELSESDQEKYIHQRLGDKSENNRICISYTEAEVKEITSRLFESVNIVYNAKNILGVPLQLFIITEIFRNDKQHYEKLKAEDIFVLTKMYKLFFQGKEKHQKKKAGVEHDRVLGNYLDSILEHYELPALYSVSRQLIIDLKIDGSNEIKKSQTFLKNIKSNGDQFGIISQINYYNGTLIPIFSHQSFAEYFACVWLEKNLNKLELIKDSFFTYRYDNLRLLFDILIAENHPLHLAVLHKNSDLVEKYIDERYLEKDKKGRTALHLIISHLKCSELTLREEWSQWKKFNLREDADPVDIRILEILSQKYHSCEADQLFNWNYFEYALRRNQLFPFEIILQTCDSKHCLNNDFSKLSATFKKSPEELLELCCYFGYSYLMKTLIHRYSNDVKKIVRDLMISIINGFKPNTRPIFLQNYSEIIKTLIAYGLDINEKLFKIKNYIDKHILFNPLQVACVYGNYKFLKILLDFEVDVNVLTTNNETVLHITLRKGYVQLVKPLLETETVHIIINKMDNNKRTPLHCACTYGDYDLVETLLQKGADINAVTNKNQTPLHLATENGDTQLIKELINKGCKIDETDINNWTPLHYACKYGRYDVVDVLLEKDADVNAVTNKQQTPLHLTSENCWIRKNVSINKKQTPLHVESGNDSTKNKLIELLINKGCNVNEIDENNWTPLHYACEHGRYDVVEMLLQKGADLNALTNKRQTPLHLASENYRSTKNAFTNKKQTPLSAEHYSINNINRVIVLLVKKGCNINETDENGWTPLHYACKYGNHEIVKVLLRNGADLNVVTNENQTPLDIAKNNYNGPIIHIINKYMLGPDYLTLLGINPLTGSIQGVFK